MNQNRTVTDDQVVQALDVKRQQFLNSWKDNKQANVCDKWAFNHILTVLNHTRKIFEMSPEDWKSLTEEISKES